MCTVFYIKCYLYISECIVQNTMKYAIFSEIYNTNIVLYSKYIMCSMFCEILVLSI